MIKTLLKQYINNALHKITKNDVSFDIRIPSKEFGDYSSNIGLVLCKQLHQSPQDINLRLINILNKSKDFTKYFSQIQEANGFLNFTLNPKFVHQEIKNINKQKEKYFMVKNSTKKKPKVQVEFVSANPTGPLTLANARAAFYGKALADILSYNGFQVEKEFYVNNTGKQIYNLGIAIIKAWKLNPGDYGYKFNELDIYKGNYINEISVIIRSKIKGDLETYVKKHSPDDIGSMAVKENLAQIKYVLSKKANIVFDNWFLETDLKKLGYLDKVFKWLVNEGFTYKKDGALWLKTTKMFNDDKDRVLQRSEGGLETYFLNDIAYHLEKFSHRKFDWVIDIFGADHFTHAQKMIWVVNKMKETGIIKPSSRFDIILIQFMTLLKNGKPFKMSKRQGNFITFEDFIDAVGKDAASFFILERSTDTHLDFDYDLAIEQSDKNPVYYIQYAYARICSIQNKFTKSVKTHKQNIDLSLLNNKNEIDLMKEILRLPDILHDISSTFEVHLLTNYVVNLAKAFHSFYQNCPIIKSEEKLQASRLFLLDATKITFELCFSIMNIDTKKHM